MTLRYNPCVAVLASVALLLSTGCSDPEPASETASVTDSAGVTIATLPVRAGASPVSLTASNAVLSIGGASAPEDEQLTFVNGAVINDGSLVLSANGERVVRAYSLEGELLWETGGDGDGPGEFRALGRAFGYRGDSIAVWDFRLNRMSILDSQGNYGRSFTPGESQVVNAATSPVGVLGDGSFVFTAQQFSFGGEGLNRSPMTVLVYDSVGESPMTLVEEPGVERFMRRGSQGVLFPPLIFGRTTHVTSAGNSIAIGTNDRFDVRVYRAGDLARVFRSSVAPTPPSEEIVARARADYLENEGFSMLSEEQNREMVEAMPVPDAMPAHGGLLFDAEGRLWIERYDVDSRAPDMWDVFDGTDRVMSVALPPDSRLGAANDSHAVIVVRDDLGVETVLVLRLPD